MMRCFLVVPMLTVLALPAAAQGVVERAGLTHPVRATVTHWEPSFRRDSVSPNQWKKGAVIGAGAGAAVGLLLYSFAKANDDSNRSKIPLLIGPILIFALVGGMIGSSSHK